jgi:DNA-binding NtrC family response regulator
VRQDHFRADLYYRIHVIPITIPPLRERREDIVAISDHFLTRLASDTGEPKRSLYPELMEILNTYDWPGNVRELQNVLERAVAMTRSRLLRPEHMPDHLLRTTPHLRKEVAPGSLAKVKAEAERNAIIAALQAAEGNKTRAAALLRIHRVKLHEKLKRYRIASSVSI